MNRLLRLIRLITLVLCTTVLTVMLFSGAPAYAEAFVGMISGRTETGFTLHTEGKTLNTVITKDTVWDVSDGLENGDVVTIFSDKPVYHGLLYAQTVTCHTLRGVISRVVEGEEPYLLLLPENGMDEIRVNLPAINLSGMAAGITVRVYYNGMQTRSIPPQITALYLRGATLLRRFTPPSFAQIRCAPCPYSRLLSRPVLPQSAFSRGAPLWFGSRRTRRFTPQTGQFFYSLLIWLMPSSLFLSTNISASAVARLVAYGTPCVSHRRSMLS